MSRIKNYYHNLWEWQHLCENNDNISIPQQVLDEYNISIYDAIAMGINVESLPPVDDYTDEERSYYYFLQNKYENELLDAEWEALKPGESILISVHQDDEGNVYKEYLTKE